MADEEKKRPETDEEFIVRALSDMMEGWVPLKLYLRMYPDETKRAVEHRVRRGYWTPRVEYFCPKGGTAWVNIPAIKRWVSGESEAPSEEGAAPTIQ